MVRFGGTLMWHRSRNSCSVCTEQSGDTGPPTEGLQYYVVVWRMRLVPVPGFGPYLRFLNDALLLKNKLEPHSEIHGTKRSAEAAPVIVTGVVT